MDVYFWSDGWFGFFCYMIWLGFLGEKIGLCLLCCFFLWVRSWEVSWVGPGGWCFCSSCWSLGEESAVIRSGLEWRGMFTVSSYVSFILSWGFCSASFCVEREHVIMLVFPFVFRVVFVFLLFWCFYCCSSIWDFLGCQFWTVFLGGGLVGVPPSGCFRSVWDVSSWYFGQR